MNTVTFCNRGALDLDTLTTMGVSVKKTDSAIGYFGTGLKFAVATLLRTGHTIEVWVSGVCHRISARERLIRGEPFQVVHLNDEPLGYTTMLGRNWEPWQAYRELRCNAMDEPSPLITTQPVRPTDHDTVIRVTGDGIAQAHMQRDTIFCSSRVLFELPGVAQIREGSSNSVFYRGVRVHRLQERSRFTWNFLCHLELTEDRTLAAPWALTYRLGETLAACDSTELVCQALSPDERVLETTAYFAAVSEASPQFMEAVRLMAHQAGFSTTARALWERQSPTEDVYRACVLTDEEQRLVDDAVRICRRIDPDFQSEPTFVSSLGVGVLGMVRDHRVLIARSTIDMGVRMLAGTLYEEYLHLYHSLTDESRELQNHLLNQLVRMADDR